MLTSQVRATDRHALAVRHLPLVKAITLRARQRLPRVFESEDLYGAGTVGLVEAVRRFNPSCGVTFGQFAKVVIERSVSDHVREGTAANRQHRRDTRAGRPPLVAEEVPVASATRVRDPQASPEALCMQAERAALVQQAIAELPQRYRAVIVRCYFRGKPSPPLTSPKASRLHREAIQRLRVALERRGLTAECFT